LSSLAALPYSAMNRITVSGVGFDHRHSRSSGLVLAARAGSLLLGPDPQVEWCGDWSRNSLSPNHAAS
jgi:hypothetical protein